MGKYPHVYGLEGLLLLIQKHSPKELTKELQKVYGKVQLKGKIVFGAKKKKNVKSMHSFSIMCISHEISKTPSYIFQHCLKFSRLFFLTKMKILILKSTQNCKESMTARIKQSTCTSHFNSQLPIHSGQNSAVPALRDTQP